MQLAVVGRGRLGGALARGAHAVGHDVTLLRRAEAAPRDAAPLREEALAPRLDWEHFDLVLLAFEKKAATRAELEGDPDLAPLRRIPASVPIASVVWTPAPELVDAFLAPAPVVHFLTTPAAELPGAVALLPPNAASADALREAFPRLHWVEADEEEYPRLALLLLGGAMAAAALGHLARQLGDALGESETALLPRVLDDAKRLLQLSGGDPLRAFASVATPGGLTARIHDALFATKWTTEA